MKSATLPRLSVPARKSACFAVRTGVALLLLGLAACETQTDSAIRPNTAAVAIDVPSAPEPPEDLRMETTGADRNLVGGAASAFGVPDAAGISFVNAARGRSCSQSSVVLAGVCTRGNDGNTNQSWWAGSVFHTDLDTNAYWVTEISRGNIALIKIYNRTDSGMERLGDFTVHARYARTKKWKVVGSYAGAGAPLIDIDTRAAFQSDDFDMVAITLHDTNYLHLAEVEVWGHRQVR